MWQVEFFHWNTIWHFLFRQQTNNSNRQINKNKNLIFGWKSIFVTNFIFCQIFGHFGSISLKNADVMLLGRLKQKVTNEAGMRDLKPFLWVIVASNRIITSRRSVEMPCNWLQTTCNRMTIEKMGCFRKSVWYPKKTIYTPVELLFVIHVLEKNVFFSLQG